MVAIRAIYDGESFKPLPTESVPKVEGEVLVTILFNGAATAPLANDSQREIAEQLWAIRAGLPSLGMSIPELIEEGRER